MTLGESYDGAAAVRALAARDTGDEEEELSLVKDA